MELSAFYFSVLKDRLAFRAEYSGQSGQRRRRSGDLAKIPLAGADREFYLRRNQGLSLAQEKRCGKRQLWRLFPNAGEILGSESKDEERQKADWALRVASVKK